MSKRIFVDALLSFLERREARHLSWGFYNVSFDGMDVEAALVDEGPEDLNDGWRALQTTGVLMPGLLDEMSYHGLLHQLEDGRYRTRFGETVRLIANLRQLFRPQDWNVGRRLVGDLQLQLSQRKYPRRDQTAGACWEDLASVAVNSRGIQEEVFRALSSTPSGQSLEFSGFQRRAFKHIFASYGAQGLSGSIVSAGTGAGKTKAFYIPAFLGLAADLAMDQAPYTKIIAIYPRNVLLADQLREALAEASKIAPVLSRHGLRPITFGALLGDTPRRYFFDRERDGRYRVESFERSAWKNRTPDGFPIPFLRSPVAPEEKLIWRDEDRTAGRTTLYRPGQVTPDVPDQTLLILREDIQRRPPDVLFLSLEMLNRELGNPDWASTFGIDATDGRRPRLLLLDEVHTYSGLAGAQAAWVLRRWMYAARTARSLHVVGLSATLREAPRHLGAVSGVAPGSVTEFRPSEDESVGEGMEYNLAVKGDASSATSLLSTSIQTAMLIARSQTPRELPRPVDPDSIASGAFYAPKVFAFSDNLDVLNRWLTDLSDSENQRLARFRLPPADRQPPLVLSPAIERQMRDAGQVWDLPHRLQYDLNRSLRVTRCSSQDPGVDTASDIVVATAALEVGYDDPDVGVTMHHKAPRSIASFVQRKGRAGRRRGTRPWTVVVLSDYGVDRWAFQQVEKLFDPEIEALALPMANPYVLRIQATSFLIDWMGRRIGHGAPYDYLAKPEPRSSAAQGQARKILDDFLEQGREWRKFRRDFFYAFRYPFGGGGEALSDEALDAILWEEPRPLITQAIPALVRKLERGWTFAQESRANDVEDRGANRPLPQFLPPATFADLAVAEARLSFPPGTRKPDEHESVSRVLFEACPGNVSKRFSTRLNESGYWHTLSQRLMQGGPVQLSMDEAFANSLFIDRVDGVDIYQPTEVTLAPRPQNVGDTSRGFWDWRSTLRTIGQGRELPILTELPWTRIVRTTTAHLHRDSCAVEVVRHAHTSSYEVRVGTANPVQGTVTLVRRADDGTTTEQAVGFHQRVDGIVFDVNPEWVDACSAGLDVETAARFRPVFFLEKLTTVLARDVGINQFLAEWLWQTAMASLTATAALQRVHLRDAQALLHGRRPQAAARVLDAIIPPALQGTTAAPPLKTRILAAWNDPIVLQAIEDIEPCLWEPPTEEFTAWARQRYLATVAQSVRSAALACVPGLSEDDVIVDVVGDARIVLTEAASGGLGHMERIVRELRQDPDGFHAALEDALVFCPRQRTAVTLTRAVHEANAEGSALASAFSEVRATRSSADVDRARSNLTRALAERGLPANRSAVVAIVTRLLRPGSRVSTDQAIDLLNRGWRRLSRRLGVDIDVRVFAYVCVRNPSIFRRLSRLLQTIGDGDQPTMSQTYAILQQSLFGPCEDACPECLDQPHRFSPFGRPSRALAALWLLLPSQPVDADSNPVDWCDVVRRRLVADRRVQLRTSHARLPEVAATLQALLAEEVDYGHLLVPITLVRTERLEQGWLFTLQLRETTYA